MENPRSTDLPPAARHASASPAAPSTPALASPAPASPAFLRDAGLGALLRPEAYDHPVQLPITLIETHISWVLLTGPYAYKLKRPVDLGFLNFSTAERRRHFCCEELRLNRRLSPDLYLDVVPLRGPLEQARFHGDGPVIDHAVRMRQFPQSALLSEVLRRGSTAPATPAGTRLDEQPPDEKPLDQPCFDQQRFDQHPLDQQPLDQHRLDALIDRLADDLARFHAAAPVAPASGPHGSPLAVREPALANLATLEQQPLLAADPRSPERLQRLQRWTEEQARRLAPRFAERLAGGRVRECHGDLHLGNMLLQGDHIAVFDCLEFSDTLRWVDVISEMAFLVMDLQEHAQPRLAMRLLNRWLEQSGDWAGLELWSWYACYRALVRAKVAALGHSPELHRYLALAEQLITPRPTLLAITTGVSGTGKSRHSLALAERLGWIRLRSDVERKRLFGLWGQPARAERQGDPYRLEITQELFAERLPALAARLIRAGFPVVVDATFLRRADRERMAGLAAELAVPFLILEPQAPPPLAREWIRGRLRHGRDPSDATEAVLEQQLAMAEALTAEERRRTLTIEPDADPDQLAAGVRAWLAATAPPAPAPPAPASAPEPPRPEPLDPELFGPELLGSESPPAGPPLPAAPPPPAERSGD